MNTVFSIASMAYELFESSNIEQKRKLINYVFSNLELEGVTLRYSLRKPFDLMVDCSTRSEWLGHKDSNLDLRIQRPTYCRYTMPQLSLLVFIIISTQSSSLPEVKYEIHLNK